MKNNLFARSAITVLLSATLANVQTKGANYYFSSSQGDDSRTATQAKSPSTPWKTLKKLNSFFANLKPGDAVLFKRGDTFYGSITISASGTSSSPIILGAYGSGNKPVITELVTLSGWTSLGGGIYESSVISYAGPAVNMVTINGNVRQMGRYPNANAANIGYLTYQSHSGQTSITSNKISGIPNFTGGEVVIRPIRHVLDRCVITGQTSTTVSYIKVSSYVPGNGYGFFFQNHIKTLDQFGEWYYNPKTKKLDIYFGSNKPSSYTVRCSTQDVCVTGQSKSYVTFDNIMFTGANTNAFDFLGGSHISINNCDILNSGQDGIFTQNTSFVKVNNTTVTWCNSNGIFLQAPSTDISNSVTNCIVKKTGTFAGMGESGGMSYQGIIASGGKNTVMNNTIDSTGYNGIKFLFGNSNLIKNNYITHYCFIKNDGGGIYTWNNVRDKNGNLNAKTYYGNKIIGNIVINAGNADAGTIYSETNIDHPIYGSHGIYCDENSQNIEISGNTVANNGKGIFLHDNRNMTVENNTVFNNSERQMDVYYDDLTVPTVRNIVIKNNIFFSKDVVQETAGFRSLYNDLENFGAYNYNYYAQSIYKNNSINSKYVKNGLDFYQYYNLPGWKLDYNDDQNSKTGATTLKEYTINGLLSGNKYTNGTYNSNTLGTNAYNSGGTCVSSWNNGKLDGGTYKLSYKGTSTKSTTTNVIINVGSVSKTKNYIFRYSVVGTRNNGSVGVYLRHGTSPYDQLTPIQYFPLTTQRSDNEVLFSSPIAESNSQIVFQFNDRDSTVYLDNVKLYEANVTITNPDNYVRFYYNSTNKTKTVSLDAYYVDIKNIVYSGNISLAPYTSIILMKKSATSLVSNSLITTSSATNAIVDNNKVQLKLLAFPNPAPREFNLLIQSSHNEEAEIDVYDMNGRNVYHTKGSVTQKYSFGENFLPGVYILKVTQGNSSQALKLIK